LKDDGQMVKSERRKAKSEIISLFTFRFSLLFFTDWHEDKD